MNDHPTDSSVADGVVAPTRRAFLRKTAAAVPATVLGTAAVAQAGDFRQQLADQGAAARGVGFRPSVGRGGGGTISTASAGVARSAKGGGRVQAQAKGTNKGNGLPELYSGENRFFFHEIQADENAHVDFLVAFITAAGGTPRPHPTFQGLAMPDLRHFIQQSQVFENIGVGAYLGAAPSIFSKAGLADAASIALVEAYHAGYLNALNAEPLVPGQQPFAYPFTQAQVVAAATPFVASLNGGPAPAFDTTPSAMNDLAILNFALLLEYLERDFYNINVPVYFP